MRRRFLKRLAAVVVFTGLMLGGVGFAASAFAQQNPCAKKAQNPCKPAAKKAENPCNPCAKKAGKKGKKGKKSAAKTANACNPCAKKKPQ